LRTAAWWKGLATHNFRTDEGDLALKCPTEVSITDRREKELADQGFVPLVHCKGTDYAAFFSVQTANKPKVYDKPEANANARLSAQLPYMLAMSRFAHYLKAMMRDKLGSTMSRSQAELFLNQWIANYVIADDNASPAAKAEKPCARRALRSWKCRESQGRCAPWPSCVPTSNWMNSQCL
jgi:type VI secretion system protein ImpC